MFPLNHVAIIAIEARMHLDFGFHFFIQKEIIDIKIVIDFSQYLWGMCRDDKLDIRKHSL